MKTDSPRSSNWLVIASWISSTGSVHQHRVMLLATKNGGEVGTHGDAR